MNAFASSFLLLQYGIALLSFPFLAIADT